MPAAGAALLDLLAVDEARRTFAALGEGGRLVPGVRLPAPRAVFPRYVEKEEAGVGG
jgi:methionyl-tRNA synthetase